MGRNPRRRARNRQAERAVRDGQYGLTPRGTWQDALAEVPEDALSEDEQRRNAYLCDSCGRFIITVERHRGVTPMFLRCRATDGCDGLASSCMYRLDMLAMRLGQQHSDEAPRVLRDGWSEPTWEWYRPSARAARRQGPAGFEHYQKGGLWLREVPALPEDGTALPEDALGDPPGTPDPMPPEPGA